jgi:hypothetical protein
MAERAEKRFSNKYICDSRISIICLPLDPLFNQMHPVDIFTSYLRGNQFHIIFSSIPESSK